MEKRGENNVQICILKTLILNNRKDLVIRIPNIDDLKEEGLIRTSLQAKLIFFIPRRASVSHVCSRHACPELSKFFLALKG